MSMAPFYHNLTDDELISYVDSHPCTELERELADRLDEALGRVKELESREHEA